MKVSWSLLGLSLLYLSAECLLPPTKEELNQISLLGEKYLDKQIENAITGVKEMKTVMERTEEDHKRFRSELEKTKQKKENALLEAQEMEEKLSEQQSMCNKTMQALWEECKPCLRKTCVKYYSRTCSSGAGLVGRQLEEVLNRTSPISIWINGQNIETLLDEDQQQTRRFQDLEERYTEVADGVDNIFMDSMKVFDHMRSFHQPSFFPSPFRMPSMFDSQSSRAARVYRSPLHNQDIHSFHSMFRPMMDMARNMFNSFGPNMGSDMDFPSEDGRVNEDVIITKPFGNDKMTCREIRRNSAGCIKLKDECEKCKEIQHIDCSGKRPLEGPLKEELERALARAERFTQEYNSLLKRFEEEMFNTSSVLDLFNKQFGWVSSLASHTKNEEGFFKIQAVLSKGSDNAETPGDTKVSVKLFDGPDRSFTVPGDIPWSDPKFSEVVAQEALDRYKQNTVVTN
ncbi:clusterin-like isoform X1 [Sinocyclocheilus grahami]|uniref:Clusterin n=2 Tax=Sinocyclocheilus grahami TaxID=75366 RepID=A0A672S323_SINGR|nr:PREDICTED: clusterin-like isoform X1 [Sinocyclocheilus grahami]